MKKTILIFCLFVKINAYADDLKKLYIDIMPEPLRLASPSKSQKSFDVHLLDSDQAFPDFSDLTKAKIKTFSGTKNIKGTMKYVGVFPMPYQHTVLLDQNRYIFLVRIYLKNPLGTDINDFTNKLTQAENIWNSSRIFFDFDYQFKFEIVTDPSKAHYKVNVLDTTRGPYSINWGRDWDSTTIAHELGHMLGLADEYETISGQSFCLDESLMCTSYNGQLMKHHFYFILRRLLK